MVVRPRRHHAPHSSATPGSSPACRESRGPGRPSRAHPARERAVLLVRVDASPIHLGEVGLDVDHDQAPEGPTRGPLVPRQEQPGLQDWSQHRPPFGRVASPRLQESAQCSRHERKREIRVEPRKQGTAGPARLVSQIATSVHLAVAGAPAAVTAGAETPLFVNAGPAGPSPANFESTSPVEIDQRPELRGRRVSGAARRVSASTTAARCSRSAQSASEPQTEIRPAFESCESHGLAPSFRCRAVSPPSVTTT